MGQYYKPTNIDKKQWLYTHDFGAGLKIMEHSYIGNDFVEVVEFLLTSFGHWHKCKLVWAGDYAEVEEGTEGQGYEGKGLNFYHMVNDDPEYEVHIKPLAPYDIQLLKDKHKIDLKKYRYIVNHTKKQFVDKDKIKVFEVYEGEDWKIHPLPLLTAEGNGQGGGDYYGDADIDLVGSWSRNSISLEKVLPKGYKELEVNFKE